MAPRVPRSTPNRTTPTVDYRISRFDEFFAAPAIDSAYTLREWLRFTDGPCVQAMVAFTAPNRVTRPSISKAFSSSSPEFKRNPLLPLGTDGCGDYFACWRRSISASEARFPARLFHRSGYQVALGTVFLSHAVESDVLSFFRAASILDGTWATKDGHLTARIELAGVSQLWPKCLQSVQLASMVGVDLDDWFPSAQYRIK